MVNAWSMKSNETKSQNQPPSQRFTFKVSFFSIFNSGTQRVEILIKDQRDENISDRNKNKVQKREWVKLVLSVSDFGIQGDPSL